MTGTMGSVLFVDLTNETFEYRKIEEDVYRSVGSGVGLAAYLLNQAIPLDADPLGPENVLGFVSGLLTGTGAPVTGRWMVVCKSPITGGWGDANCGGTLSPAIKQCGVDGIFFSGLASRPVLFLLDDNGPRIVDAGDLWGKDAVESEAILWERYKSTKKPAVAVIGMAGEKRSKIAGILNDRGRMAARSGVGAVMGSKNLKAIVLNGKQIVTVFDRPKMAELSKAFTLKVKGANMPPILKGFMVPFLGKVMSVGSTYSASDGMMAASVMKRWGTIFNNTMGLANGDDPIQNWKGTKKDLPKNTLRNMNPDKIISHETKKYHCSSCVIGCGGIVDTKELTHGEYAETHRPEYETCNAFGALLLNEDMDIIYTINERLNRAGMDSISAGSTIAFAMECYEKGLLSKNETNGLDLTWGNSSVLLELVDKMITREGIGDLLADGVKEASRRITGSEHFAITAGGQEPGMHDPRMDPLLGIHFSADPTPGRHTVGAGSYYNSLHLWEVVPWAPKIKPNTPKADDYLASEENGMKAVAGAAYKQLTDISGGCLFAMACGYQHWRLFDYLNAATGWNMTPVEAMEMGLRSQTLRQLFNVRHGIDPMAFKMSNRIAGDPALKSGPNKGKSLPIEGMMRQHWLAFGWDENGHPTQETLKKLKLDEYAGKLK
ncbi:MAG: aldehyde ferredoxin oxidoreductase family protein [Erysipelotrichaceae bacterium]